MSPQAILTQATDQYTAATALEALRAGGWIVVDKGAIARAQREAVEQYKEDAASHK